MSERQRAGRRGRPKGTPVLGRFARFLDDRLGAAHFANTALRRVFPDHWSFMFGEIALYCFLVLVGTGTYLAFFFEPSAREVVYDGSYEPMHGVTMSAAYRSALDISFDVKAGLVVRQMHHWAALVFVAAMVVHLMRVFFTGAYRRPRELNWVVGVTLLLLAIGNGFFGYSLLDDLLSGTGVRVANAIALSVPVVGASLAFLLFGGEFPTDDMIPRFFFLHVFVLPAAIAVLLTAHLGMVWRQKHTQFPGPGRTEENIEGSRLWPSYALRSVGLLFIVTAVLAGLGGLAQINPIWLYGPFRTAVSTTAVTSASQPDWYMGWLDGALRLWPAWEIRAFGFTIANPFFPGVLLPTVTFGVLYAWPWIAARRTKDVRPTYHLLDRPRDAPLRTAIGTAAFTFFVVLFVAGSNDVIAGATQVAPEDLTWLLRIAVFVLPALVFVATLGVCRELQRQPVALVRQTPDHVVRRTETGGFRADHAGSAAEGGDAAEAGERHEQHQR